MSDLISRKELWKAFTTKFDCVCSLGEVRKTIDSVPTVEPKVGAWIDDEEYNTEYGYYFAHCSECGYQMDVHENRGYHNYCPNCGAKMERSE